MFHPIFSRKITFCVLLSMALAAKALALPAEAVDRLKKATAFIEVDGSDGQASGTCFCIDVDAKKALFITNAHVVNGMNKFTIVLYPAQTNQQIFSAVLIGVNTDVDLAELRVDNPGNIEKVELGDATTLSETDEIVAFGYPLGKFLNGKSQEYPSISVNTGHVTSLQKTVDGLMNRIQIDAQVTHGNSGGPVVNGKGQVIGIVYEGIRADIAAGINFAIPINRLEKLLKDGFRPPPPVQASGPAFVAGRPGGRPPGIVPPALPPAPRDKDQRQITIRSADGMEFPPVLFPSMGVRDSKATGLALIHSFMLRPPEQMSQHIMSSTKSSAILTKALTRFVEAPPTVKTVPSAGFANGLGRIQSPTAETVQNATEELGTLDGAWFTTDLPGSGANAVGFDLQWGVVSRISLYYARETPIATKIISEAQLDESGLFTYTVTRSGSSLTFDCAASPSSAAWLNGGPASLKHKISDFKEKKRQTAIAEYKRILESKTNPQIVSGTGWTAHIGNNANLALIAANPPKFVDNPFYLCGLIGIDDYYKGGYSDAKLTHYSFKLDALINADGNRYKDAVHVFQMKDMGDDLPQILTKMNHAIPNTALPIRIKATISSKMVHPDDLAQMSPQMTFELLDWQLYDTQNNKWGPWYGETQVSWYEASPN